ncbi:MAG: alkaline phosphatase family protein [Flavobacteriaceae bacterium]|nr:alkaline phosphatase family protein [Flavobacteriaceae bacterium]
MTKRSIIFSLVFIIGIVSTISCNRKTSNTVSSIVTTNSIASEKKPYLILISLDGFRWDYLEKYKPPHLINFIKNGINSESLIPSFPTKTFPNHYTIATGMYPDKHGIIANSFFSYDKDMTYRIRDREKVEDGSFYSGNPIWIQANKANMVTASYFFVGTEANIQGLKPTYYYRFDNSVKNEVRVNQAIDWLKLPPKKRPHLITMYFSDMDDTGHKYGTKNDEELKKTLFELDKQLGVLFKGIEKTGLPVNIIIVSDHGMSTVAISNFIAIEKIENDSLYTSIDNGAIVNIHPNDKNQIDSIYTYLKKKESNFKVYKTENTPGFEYIPKNKNWGAIQILPDFGYYFSSTKGITSRKQHINTNFGVHGYDQKYKEMHGIFYANGPAFKKAYRIPSIKNIHIYPLMCEILGLEVPSNIDGNLDQIKNVLKTY